MLTLYIGNKNYSSWSMRAWLLLKAFDIEFNEQTVWFDDFAADGAFKTRLQSLTAAGKVPVLVDDEVTVWDSLAIGDYLVERFVDVPFLPRHPAERAHARSLCAEMHSGFGALRTACPMNIEADLHEIGARLWQEHADLRGDVAYLQEVWEAALQRGKPFLFGEFGMVDAFFAPVVMRLNSYALPVRPAIADYMQRVTEHSAVAAWIAAALQEHRFVATAEPYRQQRD